MQPCADTLSGLIDTIYAVGFGEKSWLDLLRAIEPPLESTSSFAFSAHPTGSMHWLYANGRAKDIVQPYQQYYGSIDPLVPRAIARFGRAMADQELMARSEYTRTEIYNDYLARNGLGHLMGAFFYRTPERIVTVSLHRPASIGPYGPSETRFLEMLVPHLARAARLQDLANTSAWRATLLRHALDRLPFGVILLDGHDRVVDANEVGLSLLGRCMRSTVRERKLADDGSLAAKGLHSAIARMRRQRGSHATEFLTLLTPTGLVRVVVTACARPELEAPGEPLPALVISLFPASCPPRASCAFIKQLFDLSPREADIAVGLIGGQTLKEAAEALRITIGTARGYLKSLLHKLGARRQSDIVRIILSASLASCHEI